MEVNGYHENPRYVSAAVDSTKEFMTRSLDPVFVGLLEDVAKAKPAPGSVQEFMLERLQATAPRQSAAAPGSVVSQEEFKASCSEYFSENVDPLVKEMVRAVTVAAPEDVRKFLIDLCLQHPEMEGVVTGHQKPAAVGSRPSSSGSDTAGLMLGSIRVVATLTVAGSDAKFSVHCPRTSRSASVTVPLSEPALKAALEAHGHMALYHLTGNLRLEEDASGKLELSWES